MLRCHKKKKDIQKKLYYIKSFPFPPTQLHSKSDPLAIEWGLVIEFQLMGCKWIIYAPVSCQAGFSMAQWVKNPPAMHGHRRQGFHPWDRKIPWRRKWQPTPGFLLGQSHGQRGLGTPKSQTGLSTEQLQAKLVEVSHTWSFWVFFHLLAVSSQGNITVGRDTRNLGHWMREAPHLTPSQARLTWTCLKPRKNLPRWNCGFCFCLLLKQYLACLTYQNIKNTLLLWQWLSTRDSFIPQGTFGKVQRHFWLHV